MSVIQTNALLFIDDQPEFYGQYRILAMQNSPALCYIACIATTVAHAASKLGATTDKAGGTDNPHALTVRDNPGRRWRVQTVSTARLRQLEDDMQLRAICVEAKRHLTLEPAEMSEPQRRSFAVRRTAMQPFLQSSGLLQALRDARGLAKLVKDAVKQSGVGRKTIYRYFWLLCVHGFEEKSLNPAFERCGGRGKARPSPDGKKRAGRPTLRKSLGLPETHPQCGVTEAMRQRALAIIDAERKPGMSTTEIYRYVIERGFVTDYRVEKNLRVPNLPTQGTYINERQFRHLLNFEHTSVQRLLAKTTKGHAARNYRGLIGRAWEGVEGPGFAYAIDSTVADIYLRSSLNRAWIIGRPVLYIVVDVWSSAVVGFYLCLTGPSWATAQVCLFNSFADPAITNDLWGLQQGLGLTPSPGVCAELWADRGEYLSEGGRRTAEKFGIDMIHTASNRPDLRGAVEVMHRIVKDEQLMFLPGAHDARLKERELRGNRAQESAMTVREYVQALMVIFLRYNVASDRIARSTAEMMAYNVDPSPAGLWHFGHTIAQRGYRKTIPLDSLISTLLPEYNLVIQKNGFYLGKLPYQLTDGSCEPLTVQARNFGAIQTTAYAYPGAAKTLWWKDPDGKLQPLLLAHTAPITPQTMFDEWLDMRATTQAAAPDRRHNQLAAHLRCQVALTDIANRAKVATAEVVRDTAQHRDAPTMSEARAMEIDAQQSTTGGVGDPVSPVDEHRRMLARQHAEMLRMQLEDRSGDVQ